MRSQENNIYSLICSSDGIKAKEIAQKYADKVLDFAWIDDFSAARNFCASHASNNWILALDCDEYVNSIDIKVLRILMQKFPKYTGVIRLKNIVMKANEQIAEETTNIMQNFGENTEEMTGMNGRTQDIHAQ